MCRDLCHLTRPAMFPVISQPHVRNAQIRANIDKNGVFRKLIFRECAGIPLFPGRFSIELFRMEHFGSCQCAIDSVNCRRYNTSGISRTLSAREKSRDIRTLECTFLTQDPDR